MFKPETVLPPDEVERRLLGRAGPDFHRPTLPLSAGAIEARNNLEKARLAFEAQQKSKAMPDLKSEMSKVLDEWNKPESTTMNKKPHAAVTNNITRVLFDYVAANPGISRRDVVNRMCDAGFKTNSTSSMVGQLLNKGNLQQREGGLFTTQSEYKVIRPVKTAPTKAAPVKAAPVKIEPKDEPQVSSTWDVEAVLNTLSIKQARALYDELKKIFGG